MLGGRPKIKLKELVEFRKVVGVGISVVSGQVGIVSIEVGIGIGASVGAITRSNNGPVMHAIIVMI